MIGNIITVTFFGSETLKDSPPLWQWDYGQMLRIKGLPLPSVYTVHFSDLEFTGESTTQIGDADGVAIPSKLLESGKNLYAWIYLHTGDDDGETEYRIKIPVLKRSKPEELDPSEEDQKTINQLINRLTDALDAIGDAESAATLSESWAVGGTGTRSGEDANNAKFYASVARQNAEDAGFAWFDIDDSDGNMYVKVTDDLAEDVTFAINEESGELEVTVA